MFKVNNKNTRTTVVIDRISLIGHDSVRILLKWDVSPHINSLYGWIIFLLGNNPTQPLKNRHAGWYEKCLTQVRRLTELRCLTSHKQHLNEISLGLMWDLTWVGWIHSHINDLLLESEIHHSARISLRWDIPLRWDVSPHINSL